MSVTYKRQFSRRKRWPPEVEEMFYKPKTWRDFLVEHKQNHSAPLETKVEAVPLETLPSDAEAQVGQELSRQLEEKYGRGVRALVQRRPPNESIGDKLPSSPENFSGLASAKCEVCGTAFVPKSAKGRYCSARCRKRAQRSRCHNSGE